MKLSYNPCAKGYIVVHHTGFTSKMLSSFTFNSTCSAQLEQPTFLDQNLLLSLEEHGSL